MSLLGHDAAWGGIQGTNFREMRQLRQLMRKSEKFGQIW